MVCTRLDRDRCPGPAWDVASAVPAPHVLPPRTRRLGGRVVDLVVAGWVLAFVAIEIDGRLLGGDVLARKPIDAVTPEGTRLVVITALVLAVLEVLPTALWGRTPGKVMLGLRCVDVRTGRAPGFARSVLRSLLLHAWVGIPAVGWLLPVAITATTVLSPSTRGLHDRLSGTVVVDAADPTAEVEQYLRDAT